LADEMAVAVRRQSGRAYRRGVAATPLLLAKLWAVIPKLWERPVVRTAAHALKRLSLVPLVGGALFVFLTGLFNIQLYYAWKFSFIPTHYYASLIFLGALALHIALKLGVMRRAFAGEGMLRPLRRDLAATRAEDPDVSDSVPTEPRPATVSRRGFVAAVDGTSLGLALMMAGQSIGGPLRKWKAGARRRPGPASRSLTSRDWSDLGTPRS
jgi:hypothetical protein